MKPPNIEIKKTPWRAGANKLHMQASCPRTGFVWEKWIYYARGVRSSEEMAERELMHILETFYDKHLEEFDLKSSPELEAYDLVDQEE